MLSVIGWYYCDPVGVGGCGCVYCEIKQKSNYIFVSLRTKTFSVGERRHSYKVDKV